MRSRCSRRRSRLCESKLGPDHPVTLWDRDFLATAYESLGRWAEAEVLCRDTLARRRKAEKPDSPLVAGDLAQLGRNLLMQSRWAEAEPLLRECLAICEKASADDWKRYDAMSLLGGSLAGPGPLRRGRAAGRPRLRGDEGTRVADHRAGPVPPPRGGRAGGPPVRGMGQAREGDEWKAKLGMPDLPAEVLDCPE